MKLVELRLLAYGPFTNVVLDLSSGGVHLIYGKNEAGKSTALRAITGLFYGIARNTPDAHVHRMPELRVGGTLRGPDGASIEVVRRKGKENTLLDREGRPLDEAAVTRLFGGVSQEQFLGMFGLDHESLRRGGEALLLGGGEVGESLFGAAMAGGELHRVLRELGEEADALFTPKGYTKPLNEALKAFAEAEKRTREQSMSPASMIEQASGLAELRRDQKDCESDRQRLHLERAALERLRRALPILARRRAATERRRELGSVPLLPPEAGSTRSEQVRIIDETEHEGARLTAHLGALTERRAELTLPESLVRFDEVPLDLGGRLGTYGKTLIELPRLRGEIEQEEEEARAALRRAGRDVAAEGAANFRIDPALQATVHKLVLEDAKWHEGKAHTERRLAEHRARLAALTATRAALPAARAATTLKKAILRAERDGALEERLLRARAEKARVEERARAELGGLGLADRSLTDVTSMAVPTLETVERFAEQLTKLEEEGRQTAERINSAETRRGALTRDIDALERGGHVPSEQDLARARERRDAMWHALRARETGLDASATALYEAAVRAADDLADRLRREAERVNRLAALEADRDACSRELAACSERAAEVATRAAQSNDAWRALWQPLRIVPHPPREMKSWLLRHQAFVQSSEALRETDSTAAELEGTIESHRQRLTALLDELVAALPSVSSGEPAARPLRLAELVDRAGEVAAAVENAAFERRQLDREITEQNEQLAALSARDQEHDAAKALLDQGWRAAVEPLGLRQHASPEQVTATIDLLEKAAHHRDRADLARRRAAALEREAAAFSADVERLAGEHAPDLAGGPADRVAAEIVDRYHNGRSALAARRELDRQLEDTAHQLELQRERHAAALVKVDEMKRAAGVDSLEALERAERASDELRGLEQSIVRCDEELDPLGGATALLAEAGDIDIDTVTVRLSDVDVEIEQLRERASMLDRRIGSAEAGLKDLEDPKAKAADAAADAEAALARVRDLAARYLRTRTACIVLAQEIESYRQKNQGPIMTRASELFRRLTLGSFAGLRTDFDEDDKPVLRGVRVSGDELGVEGMSEGTRDQLYLALRVATLERYAERGNPMPLVLDDILVHFDDDRARAALELLGELAGRLQILFFTHHARIVDLARETIRGGELSVRELLESESRNGSVGAPPEALLGSALK